MKELLNTINNIKNNGVSTLVNIFTKKDQDKIINKVLNTDKFKKIYKDIDKEKAIDIFNSNFIILASKEDNKNFNRDFIIYDNGGSKEIFLYFEGSRARKWSIEGELIEIKADAEAEEIQDRQLEILNKQIKNNVINYSFRTIKEINYIKAHNYYIANIEYFNNNYDFILTIDDFKKGIKKYKSDCTEQQQKEIFFNTINNLDISVFKKLYNKYKNSNYDIKYQLNSLYLDKYNNTLDIKNITLNDCRLLNYFLEAATDREENKNSLGAENMNNKKELKPIFNTDIEGHEEYQKEELKKYNSGDLNFTHKRINNKMIEEYTKYFVYKDNTFMAVKPSEDGYPSGYYEHVKQYNYKIDHINKIILFTDTEVGEVQEVEPMGEGQKIDNNINIEEYANNLIESLPIEKNKSAVKYLDYAKENNIKTNDKNSIERKVLQTHLMRYGVSNVWYKAAEKKRVNTKEDLAKVYFNELVKMLKEEFYNIDTVDPIEEKKENNNYITLTGEQEKERKYLINLWSTKTPNDKQQGKESFLNLLFKYQEQKKTKEEFKKHINKLYAANKNIKAANAGKKDFNNYLVDILATEDILQKNDIIKNEFFTNSYNYIKCI